jgi:hypothetical protein
LKIFTTVLGKLSNILQYVTAKQLVIKVPKISHSDEMDTIQNRVASTGLIQYNNCGLGIATKSHYPRCLTSCSGSITTGSRNTPVFFPYSCQAQVGAVGNTHNLPTTTCSPKMLFVPQ